MAQRSKPSFGVGINWAHPLANGLVAFWLLNEQGAVIADATGNGNNGSITGTVPLRSPDGVSNWGTAVGVVPDSAALNTDTGTVAASIQQAPSGAHAELIQKWNGTQYPYLLRVLATSGFPSFGAYDNAQNPLATGSVSVADKRPHVLMGTRVWHGAIVLYVDGVIAGTTTDNTTATTTTSASVSLGNRYSGGDPVSGTLRFAARWSRVLSAAEAASFAADPYQMFARKPLLYKSAANTNGGTATGIATATAAAILLGLAAATGIGSTTASGQDVGAASAVGVATASASAVMIGAGNATGGATVSASGQLVGYSSATGIATATAAGRPQGAATASGIASASASGWDIGAGSATGIANATALAGSTGNGGTATGAANATASGRDLGAGAASGVATASATAIEIGAGSATGSANASASGQTIGGGAATGIASASASPTAAGSASAVGVASASASAQDLGSASASGGANASASGVVLGAGSATGVAVASATPGGLAHPLKATRVFAGPLIRATRVYAGPLIRATRVETFPN